MTQEVAGANPVIHPTHDSRATLQNSAQQSIPTIAPEKPASSEVCTRVQNEDLNRDFSRQVSAKGDGAVSQDQQHLPPDLAGVVNAWPSLPAHIRAAILALVRTRGPRP